MATDKWKMDSVDPTPHLERFESYEQARREFRWVIPPRFNIATAICRRHTDASIRVAVSEVKPAGINTYTFGGLDFLSDKFATVLTESGVQPGDPVAVILPQSAELAVSHFGALKTGALVVPLPVSAGAALLEHALADSGAKALVADESIYNTATAIALNVPTLEAHFVVRDLRPSASGYDRRDFWTEVDRGSSDFDAAETEANSPAFIFYVESRGRLTGVVHSHRSLIGRLSVFEMLTNLEPSKDSVFWTKDDWSSANALLNFIYPAWWYGDSFIADVTQNNEDGRLLIERAEVTHAFISSSSLKVCVKARPQQSESLGSKLRVVVSDAPLSNQLRESAERELDAAVAAVYGKTETGWIAADCERWFPQRADSAGRIAPGYSVEISDDNGDLLPANTSGRIAFHRSNPALFSEYRNDAPATRDSFIGDWFVTGDLGYLSADGSLYVTRPAYEASKEQGSSD